MNEAVNQPSQVIEFWATQIAKRKTDVAKWDLNIVVFLFSILVIVSILNTLQTNIIIVALVAILGLGVGWIMGHRRGKQLFRNFYIEELSILHQERSKAVATFMEQLTSREIEILHCVAQGFSNKKIALKLGISEQTTKNHLTSILRKLNASDRTEAVVIAIKHGIIPIE